MEATRPRPQADSGPGTIASAPAGSRVDEAREPPAPLTPGWANLPLPLSSAPEVVIDILPRQRHYHALHITNYNTSAPVCTRTRAPTTAGVSWNQALFM